jgi:hypothetical protein
MNLFKDRVVIVTGEALGSGVLQPCVLRRSAVAC